MREGQKTRKRNKCMDNLLEICLKAQKKKTPSAS